jgi:hypothetical protein
MNNTRNLGSGRGMASSPVIMITATVERGEKLL